MIKFTQVSMAALLISTLSINSVRASDTSDEVDTILPSLGQSPQTTEGILPLDNDTSSIVFQCLTLKDQLKFSTKIDSFNNPLAKHLTKNIISTSSVHIDKIQQILHAETANPSTKPWLVLCYLAENVPSFFTDLTLLKKFQQNLEGLRWNQESNIYLNKGCIIFLAHQGSLHSQKILADSYAKGEHSFQVNPVELLTLAKKGHKPAQNLVVEGYNKGKYGFQKDPEEVGKLAYQGWEKAQDYVAQALYSKKIMRSKVVRSTTGKWYYYTPSNAAKLLELAHLGWKKAQGYVAEQYISFKYGLGQNPQKLLELADLGWESAQDYVAQGYLGEYLRYGRTRAVNGFKMNRQEFLKMANSGNKYAQNSITSSCTLSSNYQKMEKLAHKGWEGAQECTVTHYVMEEYQGRTQNPEKLAAKLLELSNLGWKSAQGRVVSSCGDGSNGFKKDVHWSALLRVYYHYLNKKLTKETEAATASAVATPSQSSLSVSQSTTAQTKAPPGSRFDKKESKQEAKGQ